MQRPKRSVASAALTSQKHFLSYFNCRSSSGVWSKTVFLETSLLCAGRQLARNVLRVYSASSAMHLSVFNFKVFISNQSAFCFQVTIFLVKLFLFNDWSDTKRTFADNNKLPDGTHALCKGIKLLKNRSRKPYQTKKALKQVLLYNSNDDALIHGSARLKAETAGDK